MIALRFIGFNSKHNSAALNWACEAFRHAKLLCEISDTLHIVSTAATAAATLAFCFNFMTAKTERKKKIKQKPSVEK